MNIKHLASGLFSIVSLFALTTAGCASEPTSDSTSDTDEEFIDDEEYTGIAASALTTNETTIQTQHRYIKASYNYNNTTTYNGQTLPGCANQELDKMNASGVWGHQSCTAGKLKNLYIAGSTASIPATNWVAAVNGWKNSAGHLATINGNSKVGCATKAGAQTV
ncbi:MAG: hypothetical protein ACMG6S_11385, partial [Byssovorax sp.]